MAIPNTDGNGTSTDWSLQSVVTEVNPTTDDLVDCFADATGASFDQAYKGDLDRLLNFRNYGAVTASGVASVTISNAGSFKRVTASTYAATQRTTDGSGSGATFTVTLEANGLTFRIASVTSITAAGTGYAVGDLITLNLTSVDDGNEITYGVLEVATLG